MKALGTLKTIVTYALLIAGGAVFIIPLAWMITVSLSEPAKIALPGLHLIPNQFKWDNYKTALTLMPFGIYTINTIKVTLLALVGGVLSSAMVAYAFARLRAPGKNLLFILMLSTIMLPSMVTMVPCSSYSRTWDGMTLSCR